MTVKQEVLEMVAQLPDDCTLEEIEYRLYVLGRIRAGQEDLERRNVLTQDEVEATVARWSAP